MKRDMDSINLRGAFAPMPEETRNALMNTARSVKEEEPVRRAAISTLCIAVCIIIAATAVAMAAGSIFGWIDFFKTSDGSRVPKAAQEIMQNSGGQTYTISPVVFTVHEMYSDKNILMVSTQVSIADGEKAIICVEPCEAIGANGENGRAVAQQLGVEPVTTWVEAAKQLNLPLYKVEALAEAPAEFYGSEAFYDPLFNNDGSLTFFSVQPLNGKVASEQLDCQIWLFVEKVNLEDPEAGEAANEYMSLTVPVAPVMATHSYTLKEEYVSYGMKLITVNAELLPSGLYLYADFLANDEMTVEDFYEKGQFIPEWYNAEGKRYDWGMTETYIISTDEWPVIHTEGVIPEERIPDVLILSLVDDNTAAGSETAPRIELK